jgi:hypothetical protein
MWLLGKTMANARSDAPHSLPGQGSVLLLVALAGWAAPLSAQSRATLQVSAQVMAVQPSADGLRDAQAMVRSGDPAPVRTGGRMPLATVRRTVQGGIRTRPAPAARLAAGSSTTKPTSIVEIQFLRN